MSQRYPERGHGAIRVRKQVSRPLGSCSLVLPGSSVMSPALSTKSKQQLLRFWGASSPTTSAPSNPHRRRAGSDWRRDFRRQVPPFLAANLVDPHRSQPSLTKPHTSASPVVVVVVLSGKAPERDGDRERGRQERSLARSSLATKSRKRSETVVAYRLRIDSWMGAE